MTATGPSTIFTSTSSLEVALQMPAFSPVDGKEDAIVARPFVDVRRRGAATGIAVAEVPGEALTTPSMSVESGPVELDLAAGAGEDIVTGIGHGPLVDADRDLVGADAVRRDRHHRVP